MKKTYTTPVSQPVKMNAELSLCAASSPKWKAQVGKGGSFQNELPNELDGTASWVRDVTGDDGPASTAKRANLWDTW